MANNRMWLLHKPTGKAVFLGKRMDDSWYGTPDDVCHRIQALFAAANEFGDGGDDFALAMEDCVGAASAFNDWCYTGTGESPLSKLQITEPKTRRTGTNNA